MAQDTSETQNWATGPLHQALVAVLPLYVRELFSENPKLDVLKLHKDLGKSHEAVYQWMRVNRLLPRNAQLIVEVANRPDNVAALKMMGRKPPKVEDFSRFVFA